MRSPVETGPGRVATRRDGARSRERILDAAERLMGDHGYAGTGIAAISRASGLPASSIYWFFESKQDLTMAVIERAAERWLEGLAQAGLAEGGLPRERLQRLLLGALGRSGDAMPEFSRLAMLLLLELRQSDPAILARLRRVREQGRRLLQGALEGLFADFGAGPARQLAFSISPIALGMVEGALFARLSDPADFDLPRVVRDLDVSLRAVAKDRMQEEVP